MERITVKKDLNSKWRFNLLYLHLVYFPQKNGQKFAKKLSKMCQNCLNGDLNKLNLHLKFKCFFNRMRPIYW